MVKISLIGAGSAAFSMNLVKDLCLTRDLAGSEIALMDLDQTRLDAVYSMAKSYSAAMGANLRIVKTLDRRNALSDADFVIDTVLVGGHEQQEVVRSIGETHGYYRGVESVEFNMIQDYSTTVQGYYQLKFFLDLAKEMEELCPNALLIDIANPECEAGTLLARKTKIKAVSYCHGYLGWLDVVRTLELASEHVDFQVAGFNHNIFLTRFRSNDKDANPILEDWIKIKSESYWGNHKQLDEFDIDMSRAAVDMYKLYGLFPIGDTVRSGSWKYHYDLKTKQYWYGEFGGPDSEIGWARYLKKVEDRTRQIFTLAGRSGPDLLSAFPPVKSREQVAGLIDSIVNNRGGRFVLGVRNDGAIPGLPDDVAVEIPVRADEKGLHAEKIEPIPDRLTKMVLLPRLVRLEMALEAFVRKDKSMLLEILYRDRRTKSDQQARDVLDEILAQPFNEEMRHVYE
jgi:alpha-galactosidase